jgi:hypothetical protein
MATAVRCDSGSDGSQRRLLKTSLEHSGGTVHGSLGKCAAHQECAGSQDRPEGCGLDCTVAAVWSSVTQLCTQRNHPRSTRPDPNAGQSVPGSFAHQ